MKKLVGKWEEVGLYNDQQFCHICKQKFCNVDDSSDSKYSNVSCYDSSDKEFDLKKSHENDDKINDGDNDSNVKLHDLKKSDEDVDGINDCTMKNLIT